MASVNPENLFSQPSAFAVSDGVDNDFIFDVVAFNPEIRSDIPGVEYAIVSGRPFEAAETLYFSQRDAEINASGTCGLVTVANICILSGLEVSRAEVVSYAIENKLCDHSWWLPEKEIGGVSDKQIIEVFRHYGIEATAYSAGNEAGSLEAVAEAVESGKGVAMGLNAAYLYDEPSYTNLYPHADHEVTITGTARDPNTGEVIGFFICDSGRGLRSDAARYVSIQELNMAYSTSIPGASVVITNRPIRELGGAL